MLTQLGLEVEGISISGLGSEKLQGLIAGEVLACIPHPNADHLKLTKVSIGLNSVLSIVCGAPNVSVGQKVVVATIGTTLYPVEGEPFKIKKSKIRGEESQGMLCADDEIGLGSSHAGIIVLPQDTVVGTAVSELLQCESDAHIEIGITPNHADACSHLGVARELRAAMAANGVQAKLGYDFSTLPTLHLEPFKNPVQVNVADSARCPRYAGLYIQGIEVTSSPEWLQKKLKSIGLKPINTLVDISNYVLHDIGQPIHIFDADKIRESTIRVRESVLDETLITLDGVERKLNGTELIIADGEQPMAIAGVFGGVESGVSSSTKNIFIESAYFNPAIVRKSARAHGLNTDASFRFERGTDIEIVVWALFFAAKLITENAGGKVSNECIDIYPKIIEPALVTLRYRYLKQVIGKEIPVDEVKHILESLNISILEVSETELQVAIPSYKNDVTTEIDLCEEILRVHGLNNVPLPGRISTSLVFSSKNKLYAFREMLAQNLANKGYNEMMTNSLTKSSYQPVTENQRIALLNPLSGDMGVLRDTMLYSGLEVVAYNLNRNNDQLQLFELGRTYRQWVDAAMASSLTSEKKSNALKYIEEEHGTIFRVGKEEKLQALKPLTAPTFYELKTLVQRLLQEVGITRFETQLVENDLLSYGLSITLNKKPLAHFGAVASHILKQFDITQEVFYADLFLENIYSTSAKGFSTVKPVSKYSSVRRDLSLLIDEAITFSQLEKAAYQAERNLLKEVGVFDIYKGGQMGEGKKSYALYFILHDENKTLDDKSIQRAMHNIQQGFEKDLGAMVR